MKRTTITLAGIAAALSLAACGGIPGEPSGTVTETSTSERPSDDLVDEPTAEAEAEPVPDSSSATTADDFAVKFGQQYEWIDGVKAKVSAPQPYQRGQYAAGGEGYPEHVKLEVTITNGSDAPLDASFTSPAVTSGTREGDEIYDGDVGGGPTSSILPGRSVTFTSAYGVENSDDVVVEFAPSWDHEYAYWTVGGETA